MRLRWMEDEMKTHDLTHGWTLTELDNGAMAFKCADPRVGGIALNPEQAARLREIVKAASDPADFWDPTTKTNGTSAATA